MRLRSQATLTKLDHLVRLRHLAEARRDFQRITVGAADAIARAFHDAKQRKLAGDVRSLKDLTRESMRRMPGGEALAVVDAGMAGGVKVADPSTGAFFKIAEDMEDIYKGSSVMADKAAKHELAMLTHLHDMNAARLLTVPLASCVDVTMRDEKGRPERVYRVQGFSRHAVGKDTLRVGSGDCGVTHHVCAALDEVAAELAVELHLAPSRLQPSSCLFTRHEYRTVRGERDPDRFPFAGPATDALLERVGAARRALESSGVCAQVEADHGVMLDPLRSVHAEHVSTESGTTGGIGCRLPFDVELHALPWGEPVLLDTHRLCIPDAGVSSDSDADGAGTVAIVWAADAAVGGGAADPIIPSVRVVGVPGRGQDDAAIATLAARRVGLLADTAAHPPWWEPELGTLGSCCGVKALHTNDGRLRVLLPRADRFWRTTHLTALFPPEAAAVLREAGAEPVSPDALIAGGDDAEGSERVRLHAARGVLLGTDNVGRAADAVSWQLSECSRLGHCDDLASVRRAVKAGLHARGLGLRHAWPVMGVLLGRAGFAQSTTGFAAACASLPSPGSSGAASLERFLLAAGPEESSSNKSWIQACCVARGVAARGWAVPLATSVLLAETMVESGGTAAQAWVAQQASCGRRVKVSGAGAQCEREGSALSFGSGAAVLAEQVITSRLQGLQLKQRLCCAKAQRRDLESVLSLTGVCARASADSDLELLGLLAAAAMCEVCPGKKANIGKLQTCVFRLIERGEANAALELLEQGRDIQAMALAEDHPDHGSMLATMAQCQLHKGEFDAALELLDKCRGIYASSQGDNNPQFATILFMMAQARLSKGEHDTALGLLERCAAIWEMLLGESDPKFVNTLFAMAQCQMQKGEYDAALALLERCKDTNAKTMGTDHPHFATVLYTVAQCRRHKGEHDAALKLLERCESVYAASLGEAHPKFARTLLAMALSLRSKGEHSTALELLKRCQSIQSTSLGEDHPDFASTLFAMAQCRQSTGEHDQAFELLERCKDILALSGGEDRPDFALALYTMAQCRKDMGDYEASLKLLGQCQAMQSVLIGETHPDFARTLFTTSQCWMHKGAYDVALGMLERCVDIQTTTLGESHSDLATTLLTMAQCQRHKGQPGAALGLLERCKDIQISSLGELHPDLASTLLTMAQCHLETRQFDQALGLLERCQRIQASSLCPGHPAVAQTLFTMSQCRLGNGEHDEALELLEKVKSIWASSLGESHPHFAAVLCTMAQCRLSRNECDMALALLERCKGLFASSIGEAHPNFARTLLMMAQCWQSKGAYDTALEVLGRCRLIFASSLGEDHPIFERVNSLIGQCRRREGAQPLAPPVAEQTPLDASTLLSKARVAMGQSDFGEALRLLDKCASESDPPLPGLSHHAAALTLTTLAQRRMGMGHFKLALALLQKSASMHGLTALGDDVPALADTMALMARCRMELGDHDAAIELLGQCASSYASALGDRHPKFAKSVASIAECWRAKQGLPQGAAT